MGFLLSAFFWSYTACQLLSGWLADRFPVSWVFGIGFFLWTAATLGAGFASGLISLAILRLMMGVGQSVAFPCYSKVIAIGFPVDKRGLPNSLLDAGLKLGPAVGTFLGGLLVADYGWRIMFIVIGLGSLLWLIPWIAWASRAHPKVVAEIADHGPGMLTIVARKDAWGTFIGNFCYTYGLYFMLTWLPSYLVNERHISLRLMGMLGSLPFLGSAGLAVVCGWLSDTWIERGGSPTLVRKTFVISGLLLSTAMVPAALVPDLGASMILLCVACAALGMYASNHWAITQTKAGTAAAGMWTGMQNTVGSMAGIIAPAATGIIVERTGSYYWAFVSPAVLALVGVCCYLFMVGKVAPVDWSQRT
jgi:MFS family permease